MIFSSSFIHLDGFEVHNGNGKQNGKSKRNSNGSRISEREMMAGNAGSMKPKPVSSP